MHYHPYTAVLAELMADPHSDPETIAFLQLVETAILKHGVEKFALDLIANSYVNLEQMAA